MQAQTDRQECQVVFGNWEVPDPVPIADIQVQTDHRCAVMPVNIVVVASTVTQQYGPRRLSGQGAAQHGLTSSPAARNSATPTFASGHNHGRLNPRTPPLMKFEVGGPCGNRTHDLRNERQSAHQTFRRRSRKLTTELSISLR